MVGWRHAAVGTGGFEPQSQSVQPPTHPTGNADPKSVVSPPRSAPSFPLAQAARVLRQHRCYAILNAIQPCCVECRTEVNQYGTGNFPDSRRFGRCGLWHREEKQNRVDRIHRGPADHRRSVWGVRVPVRAKPVLSPRSAPRGSIATGRPV